MRKHWERLQKDGWTQQKLGEAMGYPAPSARKSVSQFLKSHDPAISMLRRFARAAGVSLADLLGVILGFLSPEFQGSEYRDLRLDGNLDHGFHRYCRIGWPSEFVWLAIHRD